VNYYTSDWHIGHHNIIIYDQRPFKDVDHMHTVLVNNYNSTVGDKDTCYFIGDMGICRGDTISNVIKRLRPNPKILIIGNHDKKPKFFLDMGFAAVMYGCTQQIANIRVTITHCPLMKVVVEDVTKMKGGKQGEAWHGEYRHAKFSIENLGQFHLHGHIHSAPEKNIRGRQFDVGVRANKYTPVSELRLAGWIQQSIEKEKRNGSA
jgi:calcineurin-like phosphoesterase family protein